MDMPSSSRSIGKRGIKNDGQVSRGAKRRCFKKDQLKEDVGNDDSDEEKSCREWKEDEDIPFPKNLCDDVTRIYEDVMSRYRNMIDAEGPISIAISVVQIN
ncbi:hypothetical protein X798_04722 [Onchocerca flexuosa]|uniref:Uncharacterized protein n=1 Tax=Onchocerca flexuosa TaxID=387005 RepID=A0A238BSG9_9BILA|nr:hypothetical protein X798_04722 [Onchocerca flexuosa]